MGLENEFIIRLGVFLGLFVALALVERVLPRRQIGQTKARRWVTNWALSFTNILALRLVALALPFLAIGAAVDAQANGFGVCIRCTTLIRKWMLQRRSVFTP